MPAACKHQVRFRRAPLCIQPICRSCRRRLFRQSASCQQRVNLCSMTAATSCCQYQSAIKAKLCASFWKPTPSSLSGCRLTCCQLLLQLLVLPVSAELLQQTPCPQTNTAQSTQVIGHDSTPICFGRVVVVCDWQCVCRLLIRPSPSQLPHFHAHVICNTSFILCLSACHPCSQRLPLVVLPVICHWYHADAVPAVAVPVAWH